MRCNLDDLLAGLIFVALGVLFTWGGWNLEIGPALQMGPGNFPIAVCLILCAIGLVIIAQSFTSRTPASQPVPWRGIVFTLAAPVLFGLTVRGAGFVPAVALTVFSSSFASTRFRILSALALTSGITLGCLIIFVYALDVTIPILGPWITG